MVLDASYKARLYDLVHPNPGSADDDLKDLAGDPAVEAAIK